MTYTFWNRLRYPLSSATTIEAYLADLQKVSDSGCRDIPTEVLDTIAEASGDESNRREIMAFIQKCLKGPTPDKQWHRLYGALVLIEELMRKGDPRFLIETAEGRYFDVLQQLCFIQHFHNSDKRVEKLVRSKATAVRAELVPKLQNAAADGCSNDVEDVCSPEEEKKSQGEASTCANSVISNNTMLTDASSDAAKRGSADSAVHVQPSLPIINPATNPRTPPTCVVLNGIVAVGHSEDTTDESSGDEDDGVQYQHVKPKERTLKELRAAHASKSEHSGYLASQTPETSAPIGNLLDL